MIYRIAITGTESTGKTVLTEQLAHHYQTIFVPDQSRIYIDELQGKLYTSEDVLEIAHRIIREEDLLADKANRILFTDNDLINIRIWLETYKWEVPEWLKEEIIKREPDLYLLCDIDIDWQEDSQRDRPNDRVTLLYRFINYLEALPANYKMISGEGENRLQMAMKYVDAFLKSIAQFKG